MSESPWGKEIQKSNTPEGLRKENWTASLLKIAEKAIESQGIVGDTPFAISDVSNDRFTIAAQSGVTRNLNVIADQLRNSVNEANELLQQQNYGGMILLREEQNRLEVIMT